MVNFRKKTKHKADSILNTKTQLRFVLLPKCGWVHLKFVFFFCSVNVDHLRIFRKSIYKRSKRTGRTSGHKKALKCFPTTSVFFLISREQFLQQSFRETSVFMTVLIRNIKHSMMCFGRDLPHSPSKRLFLWINWSGLIKVLEHWSSVWTEYWTIFFHSNKRFCQIKKNTIWRCSGFPNSLG